MKTIPPPKPIPTTISLVQKGHFKLPSLTSSAVRSIRTHSDQIMQATAIIWKATEQNIFRRSAWLSSRVSH